MTCVCCGRELADGAYVCMGCGVTKPTAQLTEIADMTPAARDVAHGLSSRRGGSGGSGKPGSRLPLDLGATSKLDAVQGELIGWVRVIGEERGVSVDLIGPGKPDDLIVAASEWLLGHLGWLRHRQEVTEALSGFEACARVVRSIARGPRDQTFLGPCGAETEVDTQVVEPETLAIRTVPVLASCEGDVYGPAGGAKGTCRTCGAQVSQDERRAWLDAEVRGWAFTARAIAEAHQLSVKTIRSWADRGHLKSYWRTELGLTVEWVDPELDPKLKDDELRTRLGEISDEIQARGGRLHYVGDVLDLAADDAARRETERAKRERRAAERAEEASAA